MLSITFCVLLISVQAGVLIVLDSELRGEYLNNIALYQTSKGYIQVLE